MRKTTFLTFLLFALYGFSQSCPEPTNNGENPIIVAQCDIETGFTPFNLDNIQIPKGPTEVVFFFESLNDMTATPPNPISNTSAFENRTQYQDILYVAVIDILTQCPTNLYTVILAAIPTILPNDLNIELYECDDDNDGFATFDFSGVSDQVITQINTTLPSAQPLPLKYYLSEDDATNQINEITNTSSYVNVTLDRQVIYARVEEGLSGCISIGPLVVLNASPLTITEFIPFEACFDSQSGLASFDTSNLESMVAGGSNPSLVISYFESDGVTPLPQNEVLDIKNGTYQLSADKSINVIVSGEGENPCGEDADLSFIVGEACPVLNTKELTKINVFISPNPTTDMIYIATNSKSEIYNLSVFSLTGQVVKSLSKANSISLKGLTAGIYFIEITSNVGSVVKKIVKI